MKGNGVFDVLSMSLFSMTQIPDFYYVSAINSKLISLYVDNFINNTSHFQINDARQLPIIIPSRKALQEIDLIFKNTINCKKASQSLDTGKILASLQLKMDKIFSRLYHIFD